jgi:hypothetical protein
MGSDHGGTICVLIAEVELMWHATLSMRLDTILKLTQRRLSWGTGVLAPNIRGGG